MGFITMDMIVAFIGGFIAAFLLLLIIIEEAE